MFAALWRYVVGEDGKVTDIYFLTQLTPDEKISMVGPVHTHGHTHLLLHYTNPILLSCVYLELDDVVPLRAAVCMLLQHAMMCMAGLSTASRHTTASLCLPLIVQTVLHTFVPWYTWLGMHRRTVQGLFVWSAGLAELCCKRYICAVTQKHRL